MIEPSNHKKSKTFPEIEGIQIDKFGLEIYFKFNWTYEIFNHTRGGMQ